MMADVEKNKPIQEITDNQEPVDQILKLKKQIADKYVERLKTQKEGWLSSFLIGEGDALKDYLVSEWLWDKIKDAVKGNFMEKIFASVDKTIFDDLKVVKQKIDAAKTEAELTALEVEVIGGTEQLKTNNGQSKVDVSAGGVVWAAAVGTAEILPTSKKGQVLKKLDEIVKYDASHPVKYAWGWRENLKQWLDCSWLLVYTLHQVGLQMPGWNSTEMFKHVSTEKLELQDDAIQDIANIKPWDVLFWNTTNPKYDWKEASIPTTEKDGHKYRIHHVAFVKAVNSLSWKVTLVESNGAHWVVERELDYKHELEDTKHKSELYLGHLDYDQLLVYNGSKDATLTVTA